MFKKKIRDWYAEHKAFKQKMREIKRIQQLQMQQTQQTYCSGQSEKSDEVVNGIDIMDLYIMGLIDF